MAVSDRYDKTATIKSVTETSGHGWLATTSEAEDKTEYRFRRWKPRPHDRDALLTAHNLTTGDSIFRGMGEYSSALQALDILEVSATERYKVLGVEGMTAYGATPHHLALVLQEMKG